MKGLVGGLYVLFLGLLALTIGIAATRDDGLVEDDYYRRATRYLPEREREECLGLNIRLPDRLETGRTRVAAVIAASDGPLRGAEASLRAMRLSGPADDRTFRLREESPGTYASDVLIPAAGVWMLDLTVDSPLVSARRRWIAKAAAPGAPDARPPTEGGAARSGSATATAGGQTVILDISPKPVRPMRDLTFTVELPGYAGPGVPRIELGMPGMAMPPNRVDLAREADGLYRGQGAVVRCRSGRRAWEAAVTVPGGAKAVFTFDVAD